MEDKQKTILVVSAHGADWCTRCGGTLAGMVKAGYRVIVFALTYGEHGESGGFWAQNPSGPIEKCKACRKEEALAACRVLGVDEIRFFDYGDYPLFMDEDRIRSLTRDILNIRPDAVLTHWLNDPVNADHEEAGKAVIRSVFAAGMLGAYPHTPNHFIPDIFQFETTIPHSAFNGFQIDTYVNIEETFEKKLEAIRCFAVQPQLVEYYTRCAENRGFEANDWARGRKKILYAEGFKRYTPYLGDGLPLSAW